MFGDYPISHSTHRHEYPLLAGELMGTVPRRGELQLNVPAGHHTVLARAVKIRSAGHAINLEPAVPSSFVVVPLPREIGREPSLMPELIDQTPRPD
jgi:hypothetical protein